MKEAMGSPRFPRRLDVMHAMVTDPGALLGTSHGAQGAALSFRIDFRHARRRRPIPITAISGLNPFNLSAYGLHACVLRLKFRLTAVPPRISYPAAAPPYRGGSPTR